MTTRNRSLETVVGPWFVAVTVYVFGDPRRIRSCPSVILTPRSLGFAGGPIVHRRTPALFAAFVSRQPVPGETVAENATDLDAVGKTLTRIVTTIGFPGRSCISATRPLPRSYLPAFVVIPTSFRPCERL